MLETFGTICALELGKFEGLDPKNTQYFLDSIPDRKDRMKVAQAIIKDELVIREAIPPPDPRDPWAMRA